MNSKGHWDCSNSFRRRFYGTAAEKRWSQFIPDICYWRSMESTGLNHDWISSSVFQQTADMRQWVYPVHYMAYAMQTPRNIHQRVWMVALEDNQQRLDSSSYRWLRSTTEKQLGKPKKNYKNTIKDYHSSKPQMGMDAPDCYILSMGVPKFASMLYQLLLDMNTYRPRFFANFWTRDSPVAPCDVQQMLAIIKPTHMLNNIQ